jgi:hypothetical protein
MTNIFNLNNLIKVVIFFALISQISHAKELFQLISHEQNNILSEVLSWIFAVSLEMSIFIFTIKGLQRKALFFCVISILINIYYYYYQIDLSQKFIGSIIISFIIPITILFYSDLFEKPEYEDYLVEDNMVSEVKSFKRKVGRPKGSKNKILN